MPVSPSDPLPVSVTPVGGDGPAPFEGPPIPAPAEGWADDRVRDRLWWAAGTLYRSRWWLVGAVIAVGAITAALSLTIPNRYRAETRVLLPESAGFGGLLESVVPGASAILGKGNSGYSRYLAILTSRTMYEEVVDRYDLVSHYDIEDSPDSRSKAVKEIADNTAFDVSLDYDFLAVQVLDEDPQLAAQIATFFVTELNRRHIELSAGSAAENRRFLEVRLQEAEADLDSALTELQGFQERSGVVQLEAQADALMSSLAEAQGQVALAEAQYRALQAQYGDENEDVALARSVFETAQDQIRRLTGGTEAVMPVPLQRLPSLSHQYALIQAELMMQEEVLKVIRPLYEQAVLTERQEADAVQVLDPAVPPTRKAEPKRSILVLAAMASAGMLLMTAILLTAWVRRRGGEVSERLRAAGG